MATCFRYFRYGKCSGTPGRLELMHGRSLEEALVVYQSADYFIYVFCPVDEDGQCNMDRVWTCWSCFNDMKVNVVDTYDLVCF